MSERAFEFQAAFPTRMQPYKPDGEDGGVIVLEVPGSDWDTIPVLHKHAKGKRLRVLVEVLGELE